MDNESEESAQKPHQLNIPGFLIEEEIGLGDAVKKVTSFFGIRPCGTCERRASALNRWMVFTPRRSK